MATGAEVLEMLIPSGWVIVGDDYEGIQFIDCERITRAEFENGFAKYDAWKAQKDAEILAAKQAAQSKLTALGLTLDDLAALGL